jgi:hypothetical protein
MRTRTRRATLRSALRPSSRSRTSSTSVSPPSELAASRRETGELILAFRCDLYSFAALSSESELLPHVQKLLSTMIAEDGSADASRPQFPYTPLTSLYTEGMDVDQIWEQLEMRAEKVVEVLEEVGVLDDLERDDSSLTNEEKLERGMIDSDEEEEDDEDGSEGSEELSFEGMDDLEDSGDSEDEDEEVDGLSGEEDEGDSAEEDDELMDDEGMEDDEDEDEDDDTERRVRDLDASGSSSAGRRSVPPHRHGSPSRNPVRDADQTLYPAHHRTLGHIRPWTTRSSRCMPSTGRRRSSRRSRSRTGSSASTMTTMRRRRRTMMRRT